MSAPTKGTGHFVGQVVRVNCPGVPNHGKVTEIVALNVKGICQPGNREYIGHQVALPASRPPPWLTDGRAVYETHELIPVYDGHEPCAWDESLFNPFKESVKC